MMRTSEIGTPAWTVQTVELLQGLTLDLFYDVVSNGQQRVGDGHAERSCGPEIDDELELRRLLHGNIRRLCPFQDLVDKLGGAPVQLPAIGSVGHESAGLDEVPIGIHRRE